MLRIFATCQSRQKSPLDLHRSRSLFTSKFGNFCYKQYRDGPLTVTEHPSPHISREIVKPVRNAYVEDLFFVMRVTYISQWAEDRGMPLLVLRTTPNCLLQSNQDPTHNLAHTHSPRFARRLFCLIAANVPTLRVSHAKNAPNTSITAL